MLAGVTGTDKFGSLMHRRTGHKELGHTREGGIDMTGEAMTTGMESTV